MIHNNSELSTTDSIFHNIHILRLQSFRDLSNQARTITKTTPYYFSLCLFTSTSILYVKQISENPQYLFGFCNHYVTIHFQDLSVSTLQIRLLLHLDH